jgi:hypothetical protein
LRHGRGFALLIWQDAWQRMRCRAWHCHAVFAVRRRTVMPLPFQLSPLPCRYGTQQRSSFR